MEERERDAAPLNGGPKIRNSQASFYDRALDSFRDLKLSEMPFSDAPKLQLHLRNLFQRIRLPGARISRAAMLVIGFVLFSVSMIAVFADPATIRETVYAMGKVFNVGHRGPLTECDQVSQADLDRARAVPRMAAWTFVHGKQVEGVLQAPTPICVIVAVPQKPFTKHKPYDVPIESKGPDNIHLLLKSPRVSYTFPPLLPLPGQMGLNETLYDGTILYYAERKLIDPGSYHISIEQEWSNWRWGREWNITTKADSSGIIRFRTGAVLEFKNDEGRDKIIEADIYQKNYAVPQVDMFPAILNIQGSPLNLTDRPVCNDTLMAMPGRWIVDRPGAAYPVTELTDEWGYGWEGDECRLDHYTDQDMIDCFAGHAIHVYGNSNCRRISKTLLSGGRWCTDVYGKCQVEDSEEWDVKMLVQTPDGNLQEVSKHLEHHWSFTDEPAWHFDYGNRTMLHFLFLRSLSGFYRDWVKRLFNPEDINMRTPFFIPGLTVKEKAMSHPAQIMGKAKPAFVLVGFASWDAAFDNNFDEFNSTLPTFRDALMQAYPDVPIVLRLGNGMCCKQEYGYWRQRYTGTRIQHINDLIRAAFRVKGNKGMEGRITILDPMPMSGRPEVVKDYGEVFNNHPRATHVRIETQMLLNAVCARDANGKAYLKELPTSLHTKVETSDEQDSPSSDS